MHACMGYHLHGSANNPIQDDLAQAIYICAKFPVALLHCLPHHMLSLSISSQLLYMDHMAMLLLRSELENVVVVYSKYIFQKCAKSAVFKELLAMQCFSNV